MKVAYSYEVLMCLAFLVCLDEWHKQMLFWAYRMQGDTRMLAFLEVAVHNAKPKAEILEFKRIA